MPEWKKMMECHTADQSYKIMQCLKCNIAMRITKDEMVTHTDGINTDYEYLEYRCPICLKKDIRLIVFTDAHKKEIEWQKQ